MRLQMPALVSWSRASAWLAAAVAGAVLAACGGGGGAAPVPPASVAFNPAPAAGASGVSEYTEVKIEFRRAMDPATVNAATFQLRDPAQQALNCIVSYRDVTTLFPIPTETHAATLSCPVLKPGTSYSAVLTTAIREKTGAQALTRDYGWSFTTRADLGLGQWQTLPDGGPSGQARAVWTGTQMIVWSGSGGARYQPATNSWLPISTLNAPSQRTGYSMVWTGQTAIVWGGSDSSGNELGDGGIYNPATDSWTALPADPAMPGRSGHTAVWTGTEMVVWGGLVVRSFNTLPTAFAQDTGGRYSPIAGSWQATSSVGAPVRRYNHQAVWSGSRMVVWGGQGGAGLPDSYADLGDGAVYDPGSDSWQPMSLLGAPSARRNFSAVWTGSRMIVWGGSRTGSFGSERLDTGATYEPLTDSWTPVSSVGAPTARERQAAVWTGNEMIVWGGEIVVSGFLGDIPRAVATGGRYNPVTDSWAETSFTNAPMPSLNALPPSAVWTGSQLLVWAGGLNGSAGGRYQP